MSAPEMKKEPKHKITLEPLSSGRLAASAIAAVLTISLSQVACGTKPSITAPIKPRKASTTLESGSKSSPLDVLDEDISAKLATPGTSETDGVTIGDSGMPVPMGDRINPEPFRGWVVQTDYGKEIRIALECIAEMDENESVLMETFALDEAVTQLKAVMAHVNANDKSNLEVAAAAVDGLVGGTIGDVYPDSPAYRQAADKIESVYNMAFYRYQMANGETRFNPRLTFDMPSGNVMTYGVQGYRVAPGFTIIASVTPSDRSALPDELRDASRMLIAVNSDQSEYRASVVTVEPITNEIETDSGKKITTVMDSGISSIEHYLLTKLDASCEWKPSK